MKCSLLFGISVMILLFGLVKSATVNLNCYEEGQRYARCMKDAAGVIHDDFVNPSEDLKILNDKLCNNLKAVEVCVKQYTENTRSCTSTNSTAEGLSLFCPDSKGTR